MLHQPNDFNSRATARYRGIPADQNCVVGSVSDDLLALDEALAQLAAEQPVKAEPVKLRYFAGLTAAEVLQLSAATAKRYWTYARAWRYQAVAAAGRPEKDGIFSGFRETCGPKNSHCIIATLPAAL